MPENAVKQNFADSFKLFLTYTSDGERRRISDSDDIVTVEKTVDGDRLSIKLAASKPIVIKQAKLAAKYKYKPDERIFVNGYQSWTDTKEFYPYEILNSVKRRHTCALVKKYAFDSYGDASFKKYKIRVLHGFDISYTDNIFIGSYNRDNAYLIINHSIKDGRLILESDCAGYGFEGEFTAFDLTFNREEYLGSFRKEPPKKLLGYTSWYLYYQDIDEEKIMHNLESVDSRFDIFQIDDGFEPYVGDWLEIDEKKFPNGLAPIIERIHEKGLLSGIWLAPFAAETDSRVYREHPDWFIKTKAGSNWSGFYGIDIFNPEAEEYVRKCLKHYVELGFDFFKLDFLYAVNLLKRPDKTRAQISAYAYDILSQELEGKLILGCGAVLSSAAGKMDYMRVGPDVSLRFDDVLYMRFMHRERISTKITIQNTIYRSFMNGKIFGNDPDVFLLRDNDIYLSKEQREALLTINALFGSVLMTSDDIGAYDDEKKEMLDKALRLREATDKRYKRFGSKIAITYSLDGEMHKLVYNTRRGVFDER